MPDRLDRMLALCRTHVPDLRLVDKHEVRWMRALGRVIRPIVPDFSTRYTTVLGSTVYLPGPPERLHPDELASTLAHELVHQLDQRRYGPLFYASYGFLLPSLRASRALWERRAYAVDLLIARERGGEAEVRRVGGLLAELFAGPGYLWMWPGRGAAARLLEPAIRRVLDGSLDQEEPYRAILAAWRGP